MRDSIEVNLNGVFHLSLLVSNESTSNVRINFSRIEMLYNYLRNENEESIIIKVLFAKALYDLIEYFKKSTKNENEQIRNQLDQMENLCKKKFEEINRLNIFNGDIKFDIKANNIGKIYLRIVTYIIEKKKFDDFEDYKIVKKLSKDLQSININEQMSDELKNYLWETEGRNGKTLDELYKISEIRDLFDLEKIHFNYFIFQIVKETLIEGDLIEKILTRNNISFNLLDQDTKTELNEMLKEFSLSLSELESNYRGQESQTTTDRSMKRKFFRNKYASYFFSNIITKTNEYKEEKMYVNNKQELFYLNSDSKILELKRDNKYLEKCIDYLEKFFNECKEFLKNYKFKIKIDLIFFYKSENSFSNIDCKIRFENNSMLDKNIKPTDNLIGNTHNDFLIRIKNHILSNNYGYYNSYSNDSNSCLIKNTKEFYKRYDTFYDEIKNEKIKEIKRMFLLWGKNYSGDEICAIYNNINFCYFLNHDFYNIFLYILNESKYNIDIVKNETINRYEYSYSNIFYKNINNTYEKINYRVFRDLVDLVVNNEIFDCFKILVNSLNELEKNFKIRLQEFIQFNFAIEVEFKDGIFNPSFKYKFIYKLFLETIKYESLFNSISSKENEDNFDCLINHIKSFIAYKNSSSPEPDPASIIYDEFEVSDLYKNLDGNQF